MGLTMYIKFRRTNAPNYEQRPVIQVKISGDDLGKILVQAEKLAKDLTERYLGTPYHYELFPDDPSSRIT